MLKFESQIYLWLLLFIPLFILIMVAAEWHRNKSLKKIGDNSMLQALIPDVSKTRRWIKFILAQLILAVVIMVLARPQMGSKITTEKRNGIEAIICLDISNSMLAEDVKPSRLLKSKMLIENMVDNFTNDKIGLVVFAGEAFVQLPITSDFISAKMFLQNTEPSLITTQGTDIAKAISIAESSFTQQKNIGRAIIVITDGEDHEGGAAEAAEAARKKGINVFILGIGDPAGAPIPTPEGYMTDNTGTTVMTALNEPMCREIAQAGKGTYIHVDNTSAAQEKLNDELSKLQKGESEAVVYSEYNEQFQSFILIALLLIIIEVCINEAVNPYLRKIRLFNRRAIQRTSIVIAFLFMGIAGVSAQNDRHHVRQGNTAFRSGADAQAEVSYRKALSANPNNPQALYNLGCALMSQKKDSAAAVQFEKAAKLEKSPLRRSMSYHNLGVIAQRNQLYGDAIQAYKQSLRLNPSDNETRYNLVLCQRLKKDEPKNNQQQQDQNKDDKKEQKDQKDQQQQQQQQQQKQEQQPKEQMSRENAEQMLNAAMQEEKNTQQRINKAKQQSQNRQLQKNW